MASMASFIDCSSANVTNPNPRERPVSRSVIIFDSITSPKARKEFSRLSSVVAHARPPTKHLYSVIARKVLLPITENKQPQINSNRGQTEQQNKDTDGQNRCERRVSTSRLEQNRPSNLPDKSRVGTGTLTTAEKIHRRTGKLHYGSRAQGRKTLRRKRKSSCA